MGPALQERRYDLDWLGIGSISCRPVMNSPKPPPHKIPIRTFYVNSPNPSLPVYRNPCYFTMDLRTQTKRLRTPILQPLLYGRSNFRETVAITGTGLPFSSVGLYFHCFTAATAPSFRSGWPLDTTALVTLPSSSTVTFRVTRPCTRAFLARSG